MELVVELYRWIGAPVEQLVEKNKILTDPQKNELKTKFSSETGGSATPARSRRDAKSPAKAAGKKTAAGSKKTAGGTPGGAAGGGGLTKLSKTWSSDVKSAKWQDRKKSHRRTHRSACSPPRSRRI
eukprot:GABV01002876.1.p1 GENE.GABV01002876.1~~GABV01002876.1.p1  ORF type:complete len:126 (+),score=43.88 GABV01002876.1:261-638(+)